MGISSEQAKENIKRLKKERGADYMANLGSKGGKKSKRGKSK